MKDAAGKIKLERGILNKGIDDVVSLRLKRALTGAVCQISLGGPLPVGGMSQWMIVHWRIIGRGEYACLDCGEKISTCIPSETEDAVAALMQFHGERVHLKVEEVA